MSTPSTAGSTELIVVGSINIDEFFEVPHIVHSGETIASTSYSKRGGGKGANQAVSVARAGGRVAFHGAVGSDGSFLREALNAYGVDTTNLETRSEFPTGRAVIQLSTTTRDNSIVLLPGANYASSSFSRPPTAASLNRFVMLQNEIPLSRTIQAAQWAASQSEDVQVVFNPSPMLSCEQITEALSEQGWARRSIAWWVVNEGEARALLAAVSRENLRGGDDMLGRLGEVLKWSRAKGVIMTLGSEGVECLLLRLSGKRIKVGAAKVGDGGVKDTTGAGDCFTGYFATLLSSVKFSEGEQWALIVESALKVACQAAAICVEKEGAMESFPTIEEVRTRLGNEWPACFRR